VTWTRRYTPRVARRGHPQSGEHDIQLQPDQVTVQRTGSGKESVTYLALDYKARVNVLGS